MEPTIEQADKVLPVILYKYAPFVLASFIIACGAAAAMSTANSQIHSMSAVYTVDFHKTYINPNLSERKLVWVGRWCILVLSAIAYVMALYVPGLLVNIGLVALAGTAQVIVPTIGALFWKKSTVAGAISGVLTGVILLCIFTFIPCTVPGYFAFGGGGLLSLLCNVFVFIVVSCITKQRPMELMDELEKQYDDFYAKKY